MFRIPGSWHSFDHIEESLTLDELIFLNETIHEQIHADRAFAASLKGIDLDKETGRKDEESSFEEIQRKAQAKLAGKSEDELEFSSIGFGFVDGDK